MDSNDEFQRKTKQTGLKYALIQLNHDNAIIKPVIIGKATTLNYMNAAKPYLILSWVEFAESCIYYKYSTTGNTVTANTNMTHSMPQRSSWPVK